MTSGIMCSRDQETELLTIAPAGSCATLDLDDALSSCSDESLLSTILSISSSFPDSPHSFNNYPLFPSTARPSAFSQAFMEPLLGNKPTICKALITIPTSPRVSALAVESMPVQRWVVRTRESYVTEVTKLTASTCPGIPRRPRYSRRTGFGGHTMYCCAVDP